jgi:mono/diheme cytochrome c family protein
MIRNAILIAAAVAVLGIAIACNSQPRDGNAAPGAVAAAPAAAVVTPAMIEKGQGIYKLNCAPCHGVGGRGDGPASANLDPKPRDHTNAEYMQKLTDEEIAKTVQIGGAPKGMPQMPSSPQIKGDDMNALIAFIRSLSRPATTR